MTNDVFLVVGIVVLVLAIPAIVGAYVDGRVPRFAAIMVLIGGGLVVLAVTQQPGGYAFADVPRAFASVINQLIN